MTTLRLRAIARRNRERQGGEELSIASAVGAHVAEQKADQKEPTPAGIDPGVLARLMMWIPTEAITIYVIVLAALGQIKPGANQGFADLSYRSRWFLLVGVMVGVVLFVPSYYWRKGKDSGVPFKFPWFQTVACPVAFVAWALALPDTVLLTINGYSTAWGIAILTGTQLVITYVAWLLNIKPPTFDYGT